jgi:outer membrane protein
MTSHLSRLALATAFLAGGAGAAFAQTTPATPNIAQGPAIPGVCVLSVDQAIAESTVGKYVRGRLQQLAQVVSAELQPQETQLTADAKAFQAQESTLDATTRQTRGQALQARATAFQHTYEQRQREMQATQEKAINRVAQELDPVAQQLYQERHCSLLLNRQSVLIDNPAMDLTQQAITGLNAKIQQFPFDREHLDTAPAPAR